MRRLTDNKIILVTRQTRLAELKRRFGTRNQAEFYIRHLGQDFSDYEQEDDNYLQAVKRTSGILEELGQLHIVDRSFLPNYIFGSKDTVVVLGQDGLVANTVKYLNSQPVIGVNPDPARWDGLLLPFIVQDLAAVLADVFKNRRPTKTVTMAKATLNTGESMYAVNDFFVGPRTHTSARYTITCGDQTESHSSSGVIISTGLGSTGWFRSLLTGATGIIQGVGSQSAQQAQGELLGFAAPVKKNVKRRSVLSVKSGFPWDADYLCFTVREPFPSRTTQASIVYGRVTSTNPLVLVSQMPENGVIFSDGIESDFLEFRSGTKASIEIADKHGCLVI